MWGKRNRNTNRLWPFRGRKGNNIILAHSWISVPPKRRDFLVAQKVKNLPAMQDTWIRSLGWADPLEEGMATHSSILDWRIPWTVEPGRLQPMMSQRVRHECHTHTQRKGVLRKTHEVHSLGAFIRLQNDIPPPPPTHTPYHHNTKSLLTAVPFA